MVKTILVIALDNIGDLVFASSLASPLQTHFPGARIGFLAKAYARDVTDFLPGTAEMWGADPFWDTSPGGSPGNFGQFWRTLLEVRAFRPDVAIITNTDWRRSLCAFLTGAPVRIGFAQRMSRPFLTHPVSPPRLDRPIVQELARLLSPLGIDVPRPHYALKANGSLIAIRKSVACKLGEAGVATIHPFSGDPRKCIPISFWIEISKRLSHAGFQRIVVLCSPQEKNLIAPHIAEWKGKTENAVMFLQDLFPGGWKLKEAMAVLAGSKLFIGHDSGPLHIACALKVPSVGLYCPPGNPKRMPPQGLGASKIICSENPQHVSIDEVLKAVEGVMSHDSN